MTLKRKTIEEGLSSRNTPSPIPKAYSPAPDFSSPSTDRFCREEKPPERSTSGGRTLKGTVKNGIFYKDKTEASPTGSLPRTSTTLPLADYDVLRTQNKPTSRKVATRGISKRSSPSASQKRGLEGAIVQAHDAGSVAKRLKPTGRVTTSSSPTNPPLKSEPEQSASLSAYKPHQHPYSPTAKMNGTFSQRHKRSQPSKGDSERRHSK